MSHRSARFSAEPLLVLLVSSIGVAGASAILPGCSTPIVGMDAGPPDTGSDAPLPSDVRSDDASMAVLDGADAADAPTDLDAPLVIDAPSTTDVPGAVDDAGSDAPTAVDAPTTVDAPSAVDAPTTVDAPSAVDAPTSVDAPMIVDAPTAVDAGPDGGPGCGFGQHLCGAACRSNNSVATCGTSCTACVPPADSTPTCDGTSCGFSCDPTFHPCGAACAPNSSVTECGATCEVCPVPANSTPSCTGGACGFSCNTGYLPDAGGCTAAPPRPVAPLSGTNVSTRRPVFRWALPPGLTGAHIDVCTDRACTSIVYSGDATGTTHTPTSNLPVGIVFWRLYGADTTTTGTIASPTWQTNVPARSAPLSTAWGSTMDFNGDGYSDVVVCPGGPMEVRYGSATGIPVSPSRTIAPGAGGWYGAAAIDVDGDGFVDLLGTVSFYDGVPGLHMRLFRGGSSGLSVTSQASDTTGQRNVASAGDLNADGYGDVVVAGNDPARVHVFFGSAAGLPMAPSFTIDDPTGQRGFGSSGFPNHGLAEAGDLDADGYSDLVVGDSSFVGDTGRAYVYRGGPLGPTGAPIILEAPLGNGFGTIVLGAGDVNGDGREDLVVGLCSGGSCGPGASRRAYVYHGTAAGVATTPSVALGGGTSWFASQIAAGTDLTGDGYSDIVVSELGGPLHVYLGGSTSVPTTPSQSFGSNLGNPLASVGDTNGDRFGDIADGGGGGTWYVHAGMSGGVTTTASVTLNSPTLQAFVRP